jgi:CII-binding regulator of phage lambda lysogenization HflD
MENDALFLALSGVNGSLHAIKALASRGLITPEEVEAAWESIISALAGRPELEVILTSDLDELILDIRKLAADWQQLRRDYPEKS